jgi:hypothetical protein
MIKLTLLKKKLLKDVIIVASAVAVAGVVTGGAIFNQYSMSGTIETLKQQSQQEISDAQKEQVEYEDTLKAIERYEKIPPHRLPSSEFSSIQSRIRVARPIIEQLEEEYHFAQLDVKLGKMAPPVPAGENSNYSILSNDVTINFQCISDELVYSFIRAIIERLPGYTSLKSLDISRIENMNAGFVRKAQATGVAPPLVNGLMVLKWSTIQHNVAAAPDNQGAGGGGEPFAGTASEGDGQ